MSKPKIINVQVKQNPQHSNAVPGRVYRVTDEGDHYLVVKGPAAFGLYIAKRDAVEI